MDIHIYFYSYTHTHTYTFLYFIYVSIRRRLNVYFGMKYRRAQLIVERGCYKYGCGVGDVYSSDGVHGCYDREVSVSCLYCRRLVLVLLTRREASVLGFRQTGVSNIIYNFFITSSPAPPLQPLPRPPAHHRSY